MTDRIDASDGTERAQNYDPSTAAAIEARWQERWRADGLFEASNPVGAFAGPTQSEHRFLLDMFPYPSGAGLHVGHPLGFIATDVVARYWRSEGHNVLYTMGFDAFGLPAEQYAVQTGTHPRITTDQNIARYKAQLARIGMSHDERRSLATTDPGYYRWTQWIFLQLFGAWYDLDQGRARPIADLERSFEAGERAVPGGRPWADLSHRERADVLNGFRLAYQDEAAVNWAPGLGTVLANEEVTADGRSERGNYPVVRVRLRQWKLRITSYAERLLTDLEALDWPEAVKQQQRNWIGRSEGVRLGFDLVELGTRIWVYTTRADTIFGVSFLALAPDHAVVAEMLERRRAEGTAAALEAGIARLLRSQSRTAANREPDGVPTGFHATNPATGEAVPVYLVDYVISDYGTGAVMAVPGHDHRDHEFARTFGLPVRAVVVPTARGAQDALPYVEPLGRLVRSHGIDLNLDGLDVAAAEARVAEWALQRGIGRSETGYKLRDWLFSRQRYWGEPFPIVYDEDGVPCPVPDAMLPVRLPDVSDYAPRTFDPDDSESAPQSPLERATEWVTPTIDLGSGPRTYRRETNTMPNWAGSSWYELRYLDPANDDAFVDPSNEAYWMGPTRDKPAGGADLYVGGTEQAVLHLLYARFWHKVLHDLGWVSSSEPFHRLFNQGMIQAYVYRDERGMAVEADAVRETDGTFTFHGRPVTRQLGKMGKSLKNTVAPDEICDRYGADTLRVYEMSMGPLDTSRPWDPRAVVGAQRFLQRVWRNVVGPDGLVVADGPLDGPLLLKLQDTLRKYHADVPALRFNTALARLIELNNAATKLVAPPRALMEPLILMLAPFAPHLAEELWTRLGHEASLTRVPVPRPPAPTPDDGDVTCVVQVDGRLRARLTVDASISHDDLVSRAVADRRVAAFVDGRSIADVVTRPPRLVNIVLAREA